MTTHHQAYQAEIEDHTDHAVTTDRHAYQAEIEDHTDQAVTANHTDQAVTANHQADQASAAGSISETEPEFDDPYLEEDPYMQKPQDPQPPTRPLPTPARAPDLRESQDAQVLREVSFATDDDSEFEKNPADDSDWLDEMVT